MGARAPRSAQAPLMTGGPAAQCPGACRGPIPARIRRGADQLRARRREFAADVLFWPARADSETAQAGSEALQLRVSAHRNPVLSDSTWPAAQGASSVLALVRFCLLRHNSLSLCGLQHAVHGFISLQPYMASSQYKLALQRSSGTVKIARINEPELGISVVILRRR